ncbi:energy transducer TonB [Methylomonas sp. YC3]
MMEVAFIPVTLTKPHLVPPPPPPSEQKQTKPKVHRKPKLKATAPLEPKPSEFAPDTQIAESSPETPLMPESASVVSENELPSNNTEHLTEATLDAHYADNPKPSYPAIALRQGLQGRVMLRVQVTEEGMSETVMIERSSGYEILDESAVEAVKQWRFTPAKRGETAIASSVIVPIVFILEDHDQV